jgi:hypothetical protein
MPEKMNFIESLFFQLGLVLIFRFLVIRTKVNQPIAEREARGAPFFQFLHLISTFLNKFS